MNFDLMRLILKSDPIRVMASAGQAVNHLDERYGGETPDILDHGYVLGRAYLGVYTQDVTLSSGSNDPGGLFGGLFGGTTSVQIAQIVSGSAADNAGLKAGDLILKVNDTTIDSNTTLASVISGFNAGDTATLTIQRDGKEQTVSVTFGEYKPAEQ